MNLLQKVETKFDKNGKGVTIKLKFQDKMSKAWFNKTFVALLEWIVSKLDGEDGNVFPTLPPIQPENPWIGDWKTKKYPGQPDFPIVVMYGCNPVDYQPVKMPYTITNSLDGDGFTWINMSTNKDEKNDE